MNLLRKSGLSLQSAPDREVFWAIQFQIAPINVQSLGKVLSHSFFLSVEFGAIVSGTWKPTSLQEPNRTSEKHVVFSIK